ncbi:hypothetical protein KIW84_051579 [Lathyrus oleraceus]|uniref:Uncharacterized protein n=1 Tax=Pisum sativum TaxID=3888 RepID=A0A9D5AG75_PEA|nr:hypothetical protein KIW84_051579 [Pisum sativum]
MTSYVKDKSDVVNNDVDIPHYGDEQTVNTIVGYKNEGFDNDEVANEEDHMETRIEIMDTIEEKVQISPMAAFDFGEYVFEKVLKQVELYALMLPIDFTALIYGILISQRPETISSEDIVGIGASPLTFSYWLFIGTRVLDIYFPKIHFDLPNEVIMTSTACKNKVGELIKMMVLKGFEASTSHAAVSDDDDEGMGYEYGSFDDPKD